MGGYVAVAVSTVEPEENQKKMSEVEILQNTKKAVRKGKYSTGAWSGFLADAKFKTPTDGPVPVGLWGEAIDGKWDTKTKLSVANLWKDTGKQILLAGSFFEKNAFSPHFNRNCSGPKKPVPSQMAINCAYCGK